jgi:beta-xylosidase
MKFFFTFILFLFSVLLHYGQNPDSLSIPIEQYIDVIDPPIPYLDFVLEQSISDVSICKGPNHTYYLTGTTGDKYGVQDGIKVWFSADMKKWEPVDETGYVWMFNNDAVKWQREISSLNGWRQRGIIAPKIYYHYSTFWITYTNSNSNRSRAI